MERHQTHLLLALLERAPSKPVATFLCCVESLPDLSDRLQVGQLSLLSNDRSRLATVKNITAIASNGQIIFHTRVDEVKASTEQFL